MERNDDTIAQGWHEVEGAMTAPKGFMWIASNDSLFSGRRKHKLIKIQTKAKASCPERRFACQSHD